MSAVSITITNAASELERVSALADEFAVAHRLPSDVIADLHVALEEVLTNIIKYGYTDNGPHEISIQLSIEDGMLVANIEDDGRPFDPLKVPEPDVKASLRERGVGGLGIHFVRKLMNQVSYRRLADRNRLEFRKHLHS